MTGDQGRGPAAASKTGPRFIYCSSSTLLSKAPWEPINLGRNGASIARPSMDPGCAYIPLIETNPRGRKLFIKYGPRTHQHHPWGAYCHLSYSLIGKSTILCFLSNSKCCTTLHVPRPPETLSKLPGDRTVPHHTITLPVPCKRSLICIYHVRISILSSHRCFACSLYQASRPSNPLSAAPSPLSLPHAPPISSSAGFFGLLEDLIPLAGLQNDVPSISYLQPSVAVPCISVSIVQQEHVWLAIGLFCALVRKYRGDPRIPSVGVGRVH